jgi:LPXTG-motif cell wall-anchored protein
MYTVKSDDPVKFYDGEGKEMTVFDLRKGMNIKATKITEAPRTEFARTAVVTGSAAAAGSAGAATGAAAPAKAAPAAPAAPAGQTAPAAASAAPRTLPKTASPMPLVGLLGGVSLAVGAGLTLLRRRNRR